MFTLQLSCPKCSTIFHAACSQTAVRCPHCSQELQVPQLWYLTRHKQRLGPFSAEQLRQLVQSGHVAFDALVWHAGMNQWQPVGTVLAPTAAMQETIEASLRQTVQGQLAVAPQDLSMTAVDLAEEEGKGPISMIGLRAHPHLTLAWRDFRVKRRLGAGNMGVVYLAHQSSRDRDLALKLLYRHWATLPRFVDRFFREAETMLRLDHPAIVHCQGVGEEKGCPFLAMEYVAGFNAAAVAKDLGGKFALGDALFLTLRCAEALQHAHDRDIVHRDIKPENILLTGLGYVKITDLGLAKPTDEDLALTESGVSVGTPYYMAPEQAADAKHVDARADIYALGAVLYHLVTGRLPFQGRNLLDLLRAKDQGRFPSARQINPQVPPRLDLIIDKMLARDVRYRYPSCRALIDDIRALGSAPEHLSFNVLRVCHVLKPQTPARVEVLLIHDSRADVDLARQALARTGVSSHVTVLGSSAECLAYLRRQGHFFSVPLPNLIILGLNLDQPSGETMLREFRRQPWLAPVPLVILSASPRTRDILRACGLAVNLLVHAPADLQKLENLMQDLETGGVTLVE